MDFLTAITYITFISQIVVLSVFCPITYRKDMRRFIELHPEEEYPHMYYGPREELEQVIANTTNFKMLIGLLTLVGMLLGFANVLTTNGLLQFMALTLLLHISITYYLSHWLKHSVVPAIKAMKGPARRTASLQSRKLSHFIPPLFGLVTVTVLLGTLVFALLYFSSISTNLWRGLLVFFVLFTLFAVWHGLRMAQKLLIKARFDPFESDDNIRHRTHYLIKVLLGRTCFLSFVIAFITAAGIGVFSDITPWALAILFSFFGQIIGLLGVYLTKQIIERNDYSGYRKEVLLAN